MKVLGIYGSPRKGGNSDILLTEALKGAESAGASASSIRVCDYKIAGCIECGGCDNTGVCIQKDDMHKIYPQLQEADIIILASPMFFYGIPSQTKALIDRCQAMWCKRRLEKSINERKSYSSGTGYLIGVGATKGSNLFEGAKLVAKYWYDALDMNFADGMYVWSVDEKGAINNRPDALQEAFALGKKLVSST